MKIINDQIYIIEQPSHSILSIMVLEEEKVKFPISQKIHNDLPKLEECSDVFFIFLGDFNMIDMEKFTSLYGGIGYLKSKDPTLALFETLQYGKEIFETHITYAIWKFEEIETKIKDMKKVGSNFQRVTMSDLNWPIFEIRRLGPQELCDIYMKGEDNKKMNKFLELWYKYYWKDDRKENKYSTYTSDTTCQVFKRSIVEKLLEAWKNEREWIDTFTWADYRYLLASLTKHLNIKIQSHNIEEIII